MACADGQPVRHLDSGVDEQASQQRALARVVRAVDRDDGAAVTRELLPLLVGFESELPAGDGIEPGFGLGEVDGVHGYTVSFRRSSKASSSASIVTSRCSARASW